METENKNLLLFEVIRSDVYGTHIMTHAIATGVGVHGIALGKVSLMYQLLTMHSELKGVHPS